MEDRRATKSKKALKNAFLTLLKSTPINRISVKDITDLADVGRGTFYSHYLDVYDLQEKIEDEICHGLIDIFDTSYKQPGDFKKLFEGIVDYIFGLGEEISLLAEGQGNNSQLMQKIRKLFVDKISNLIPERSSTSFHKVRILFVVSGVIGVIDDWLRNNINLEKQVISKELGAILGLIQ